MSRIRIGTSGWSYPAGKGTWNGIFYPVPPGRRPRRAGGFDELRFYAEHFDTVEINSTFYGVPARSTVKGWAERTPPGFEFSLKLFQKFTHPGMFARATGQDPFALGRTDVDEFRAAIEPLAAAGKLGALLAQFPASFQNEPDARAWNGCWGSFGITPWPSSCGTGDGATIRSKRCRCWRRSAPRSRRHCRGNTPRPSSSATPN